MKRYKYEITNTKTGEISERECMTTAARAAGCTTPKDSRGKAILEELMGWQNYWDTPDKSKLRIEYKGYVIQRHPFSYEVPVSKPIEELSQKVDKLETVVEELEEITVVAEVIDNRKRNVKLTMSSVEYEATNIHTKEILAFSSLNETETYGYTRKGIMNCINGVKKTHKGMSWKINVKSEPVKEKIVIEPAPAVVVKEEVIVALPAPLIPMKVVEEEVVEDSTDEKQYKDRKVINKLSGRLKIPLYRITEEYVKDGKVKVFIKLDATGRMVATLSLNSTVPLGNGHLYPEYKGVTSEWAAILFFDSIHLDYIDDSGNMMAYVTFWWYENSSPEMRIGQVVPKEYLDEIKGKSKIGYGSCRNNQVDVVKSLILKAKEGKKSTTKKIKSNDRT